MKRLFQLGAILMLIGAFYPLLELFDCWDPPGLSNDTEYAVYAFLFGLCLVLLLCKMISLGALKFSLFSRRAFQWRAQTTPFEAGHTFIFAIPPLFVVPLRI